MLHFVARTAIVAAVLATACGTDKKDDANEPCFHVVTSFSSGCILAVVECLPDNIDDGICWVTPTSPAKCMGGCQDNEDQDCADRCIELTVDDITR